jgi:hypothetical protein
MLRRGFGFFVRAVIAANAPKTVTMRADLFSGLPFAIGALYIST